MPLSKFLPVGLSAVTLVAIFTYTMWKSPVKYFSVLRKKFLWIKSKGASKHKNVLTEPIIRTRLDSSQEYFHDVFDIYDDTDDEFHDAQEIPFEQLNRNEIFALVDSLSMKNADCQIEALNVLRKYEAEFGSSEPEFLWRIAQSLRNKSVIEKAANNLKKQNELLIEARAYAKKSLDIDDSDGHGHKWYGLICGELAQYLSLREQVNGAKIFKEHLQAAYTKLPDDYLVNHALGSFEYEASSRSYFERAAAKIVFGKLFDASRTNAIEFLMISEKARPCKRNRLCLARCYLHDNVLPTAQSWLRKAVKLPAITPDDFLIEQEILEACQDKKFKPAYNL